MTEFHNDHRKIPFWPALAKIRPGLEVWHDPNPVRARPGKKDEAYKLIWSFKTVVCCPTQHAHLLEFGCLQLVGKQWTLTTCTGQPFTSQDFEEWYRCPKSVLQPGVEYADPSNWHAGSEISDVREGLWYFVARLGTGELIKGESLARMAAEMMA
ncbi:MAG: hypothetical protein IT462_05535 [Planctomycetes bacterium]|nr:hypothetical protein [Planctomycetota bacterium]